VSSYSDFKISGYSLKDSMILVTTTRAMPHTVMMQLYHSTKSSRMLDMASINGVGIYQISAILLANEISLLQWIDSLKYKSNISTAEKDFRIIVEEHTRKFLDAKRNY
jgi:hypothetical protein